MNRTTWRTNSLAAVLSILLVFSCVPFAFAQDQVEQVGEATVDVAPSVGDEPVSGDTDQSISSDSDSSAVPQEDEGLQGSSPEDGIAAASTEQANSELLLSTSAGADEVTANSNVIAEGSGETGVGADNPADISWTLTADGVLTLTGTGAVKLFGRNPNAYPWHQFIMDNFRDTGVEIVLGEGITSVPNAFIGQGPDNYTTVNKLIVPSTLVSLGASSFSVSKIVEIEGTSPVCDGNFLYSDTTRTTIYKAKTSLKNAVIPEGVTALGNFSFYWADLDSIYLPASLTTFRAILSSGTYAAVVRGAEVSPDNPTFSVMNDVASSNYGSVIQQSNGDVVIKVTIATWTDDAGVLYTADKKQLLGAPKDLAGSYTVIPGCTGIGVGAFQDCTQLTAVLLPDGLQKIGSGAFMGCTSLTSLTIPDGVTDIGNSAFAGCTSLESIDLPDSVTAVGHGVFLDTALLSFKTPADLWKDKALASFSKDSAVIWGTGALFTTTGASALGRDNEEPQVWSPITQIDLSKYGRDYLAPYMFMGLNQLTEVNIPWNIRTLETGAFFGCTALTDVYCFNQSVNVAGAGTTGNPGLGWTSDTYPTFSSWVYDGITWKVKSMEGLNLYGLAYSSNSLIEYAQTNNCNFIPFVVFDNADSESLFGFKVTGYNTVSIADLVYTGSELTPQVKVAFTDRDGVPDRVLDSSSSNITYRDAGGNTVSSIVAPGTYTAQIIGDEKSVFGTTNVTFRVVDPNQVGGGVQNPPSSTGGVNQQAGQQTGAPVTQATTQQGAAMAQTGDAVDIMPVLAIVAGCVMTLALSSVLRRRKS